MPTNTFCVVLAVFLTVNVPGTNAGQLAILHCPPSLQFVGGNQVEQSILKDIFSVALGLSIDETYSWNDMKLVNPFEMPECAAVVHIDGVSSIGPFDDVRIYPITAESNDTDVYEFMLRRILTLQEPKCKLVNMKLYGDFYNTDVLGEYTKYKQPRMPLTSLSYDDVRDSSFLRELHALMAIVAAVKDGVIVSDGLVDFFAFQSTSLQTLANVYGPNGNKTTEAKALLNLQIRELKKAFVETYGGRVLFAVVTTDDAVTRRRRSLDDVELIPLVASSNGTDTGTDQAIIHIIFWTCTALYFSMIAIVYVMISMDPGRDSVVYRMTSSIDRVKME